MALIRSFSPVLENFVLLQTNAKLDVANQSKNWYSRVPSKSNPSDSASRLNFDEYSDAVRCEPLYEKVRASFAEFESLMRNLEMGKE